jgi:hypothetical protein
MGAGSKQEPGRHKIALKLAKGKLLQSDIRERCTKSGAVYNETENLIELPFINCTCRIHLPDLAFDPLEDGTELRLSEQILIVHYLNTASGVSLSNEVITFGQIPDGTFYVPAFRRRSIDWLVSVFGRKPDALLEAADRIGGRPADYGNVAVMFQALPRVPVTFVLWRGDEELPPSGNVLFDSTISQYLPTEDVAVLAGMLVAKLCKASS